MASAIQVTYLRHSGFAVRTRDTLLVFDDAQSPPEEKDSLATGQVTKALIGAHQQTLYFVSHAHADHYSPAIFAMADAGDVHYILGEGVPYRKDAHYLSPGEELTLGGVQVRAYGSTDEGVSFLVRAEGWSIFHAGDLNLWHWREESTLKEIEEAETAYLAEVEPLIGEEIDVAFFPLDPRLGELYDAGAQHFLMHVKPRILIPMHFWDNANASIGFARRNRSKHVEIVPLTVPGESVRAEKQEDGGIVIDM